MSVARVLSPIAILLLLTFNYPPLSARPSETSYSEPPGQSSGGQSSTDPVSIGGPNRTGGIGGGRISGRVRAPAAFLKNTRLTVLLLDGSGNTRLDATSTDERGDFLFTGIARTGLYTIYIPETGRSYQSDKQSVYLYVTPNNPPQALVTILLRLKDNLPTDRPDQPVVSVIELKQDVPKRARQLYDKARQEIEKDRPGEAVKYLQKAIEVFPDHYRANLDLGRQHIALKQYEAAESRLRRAVEINDRSPEPLLYLGYALMQRSQFGEAVNVIRRAVDMDSTSSLAHFYLGVALRSVSDLDGAIRELNRAIVLGGPVVAQAHFQLGSIFLYKKDYPQAKVHLEKYLALNPSAPEAEQIAKIIEKIDRSVNTKKD